MNINIKKITDALNRLSEMTAGEKVIPGIMLNVLDDVLCLCYNDGHKAYIEKVEYIREEGDRNGKFVVPFELFTRAIGNCQPSGSIVVRSININFEDKVLKITVDKEYLADAENGVYKRVTGNTMDLPYVSVENTTDQKAKLLDRMNYDAIFDAVMTDEWNRKELISVFNTVSTEKAKVVYMSSKIQKVYVVNTAYTCAIPIDKQFEPTQEQLDELRGTLAETNELDSYDEKASKLGDRMHFPIILSTATTKCAASILSKIDNSYEKIFVHVKDGYVCMFTDDGNIGVYFEQTRGSNIHTGSFQRFSELPYNKYQMNFIREFFVDMIKNIVNSSKNERVAFTFRDSATTPGVKELVITCQNSGASVSDVCSIEIDSPIDTENTLLNTTITISLKTLADMVNQLKSQIIALDVSDAGNGQLCIRLGDVNTDKVGKEWAKARQNIGLTLTPVLDQPLPPTPDDVKMSYRANTLDTCMYAMVQ